MEQSAQCSNCETKFQTPGIVKGKTSAVMCPKCRRVVVVQGELDAVEPAAAPSAKGTDPGTGGHAWKTRNEYDRPVTERSTEPTPEEAPAQATAAPQPIWKVAGAGLFMAACVAFMFVRIFYHSGPDPEARARMQAIREAFTGAHVVTEESKQVTVIPDAAALALADVQPQQVCMNAMFQGLAAQVVRTESGKVIAECTGAMAAPPPPTPAPQ